MRQYVALLRAINVGGNNVIKMTELRRCFEAQGFGNVATYIQSGNVLFEADAQVAGTLRGQIEEALSERFGYAARIVLRSQREMRAVVADAPPGFGAQPDLYRYAVVFLREPVTGAQAVQEIPAREGVDRVFAGAGVCYFSRLISRMTQSYMSRVVALGIYQDMTIRNWNVTRKLQTLMDARASASSD